MKQFLLAFIVSFVTTLVSMNYLTKTQGDLVQNLATNVLSGSVVDTGSTTTGTYTGLME